MSYRLRFHELALAEWRRLGLDGSLREPLKKKPAECLENPLVPASALSGRADCNKIKLRSVGYRMVYRVDEDLVCVIANAVGKRDQQPFNTAAHLRR